MKEKLTNFEEAALVYIYLESESTLSMIEGLKEGFHILNLYFKKEGKVRNIKFVLKNKTDEQ